MKLSLLRGFFEAFLFSFFELSFLRGFDLFLFVDPHCFRFLIFSFFGGFDAKSFLVFLMID
ncbi:hypothetical protein HPOKI422_06620 [Helicobacter pylori oki422]|nr:hypothetical protein HPOKI422_06620 [Helicobacter pylori oki422]